MICCMTGEEQDNNNELVSSSFLCGMSDWEGMERVNALIFDENGEGVAVVRMYLEA